MVARWLLARATSSISINWFSFECRKVIGCALLRHRIGQGISIPKRLSLSSSAGITRALRRQPKRLCRTYGRPNGGNVMVYVLISFHSRDVLCTLSRLFVWLGARLFCARLAVHYLADYSVLGSLVKDVRANCFCASLLRTQIHMPRHTSSARA